MGFFSKLFSPVTTNKSNSPVLKANRNRVLCAFYYVKGKNPNTHRIKKETVVVEATASAEEIQRKSGLLPPYEIVFIPPDPPTEKQIAYAKERGVIFPPDASIRDASIFLTRYENERPIIQPPTPDSFIRYVIGKNIFVHAYAGIHETSNLYLNGVSEAERVAFFCMRVFGCITKKYYYFLENASKSEQDIFWEFANLNKDDKAFMRSIDCYSADDLPLNACPSLKKLKAYNMAVEFLVTKGIHSS